jgi:hypothetical protein
MTEAVIFASAILTALYVIVRDAPPQPQRNLNGIARGTSNKQSSQATHEGRGDVAKLSKLAAEPR